MAGRLPRGVTTAAELLAALRVAGRTGSWPVEAASDAPAVAAGAKPLLVLSPPAPPLRAPLPAPAPSPPSFRFSCTACGACCRSLASTVLLDAPDAWRMERALTALSARGATPRAAVPRDGVAPRESAAAAGVTRARAPSPLEAEARARSGGTMAGAMAGAMVGAMAGASSSPAAAAVVSATASLPDIAPRGVRPLLGAFSLDALPDGGLPWIEEEAEEEEEEKDGERGEGASRVTAGSGGGSDGLRLRVGPHLALPIRQTEGVAPVLFLRPDAVEEGEGAAPGGAGGVAAPAPAPAGSRGKGHRAAGAPMHARAARDVRCAFAVPHAPARVGAAAPSASAGAAATATRSSPSPAPSPAPAAPPPPAARRRVDGSGALACSLGPEGMP
jgi:hypothetical protein